MTSSTMSSRLQRKMVPSCTLKLGREAEKPQTISTVDPNKTSIDFYPSEVVFQDYVPGKVYEKQLILRNTGKIPQLVNIMMKSSPYFQLAGPNDVFRQIPANSFSTLKVLFTSEGRDDHFHELICITEMGNIIVPIQAMGVRPVMHFPEQLDFSVCPVNSRSQKTLLVRNVGNLEARYHISTQSPFSVIPTMGTLNIGETMEVTVEFHPQQPGCYSKCLAVHYDTGEDAHTLLLGKALCVSIGLDKSSVKFGKIYLTLSAQEMVIIHNRHNSTARFQWKAFATEEEENHQKTRLCHRLSRPAEDQVEDLMKRRYSRLSFFSRVYKDETAKVQADPMLFSHDSFTIEPLEGEIEPNHVAEITVRFKPQDVQVYEKVAYCAITGRENRLPLRLTGEGIGPSLQFNFEVLDIGDVFAGAVHNYEAILSNKGAIDAPFELVPSKTDQGSCFTFLPQQGTIAPNRLQPIQISFSSMTMGNFEEAFQFNVTGSPEPVILTVRGCVSGLSMHFNRECLKFDDVSFGFPQTLSCRLTNTSVVPITFHLRIPEDGPGLPSITSFAQVKDNSHPSWVKGTSCQCPVKPAEFTITPCSGTIPAKGFQDIEVTLCSNDVRLYKYHMVVDVDDVGEDVLAIPITARCLVPDLRLLSTTLNFGKCALKVPYHDKLTIVNATPFPGCYGVLPQKSNSTTNVWYSSPEPCGIIQPHSTAEIPITIEARSLGHHSITGDIAVFGRARIPLRMCLKCTGEPPFVFTNMEDIDFGEIPVLQATSRTLQLCNRSIVPAAFRAEIGGKCWSIEPSKGVVPPNSEVSVIVTANLDDTEKFEDRLQLFVENRLLKVMCVQAVGTDTTVVIDKPFAPELNLGPQFSLVPCIYRFQVTNKGRRVHRLYWGTEGLSTSQQRHPLPALNFTKGRDASQRPKSASPIFKLQPRKMELMPGQTMELVLEGFSRVLQEVEEKLVCHAAVGTEITKEKIIETKVTSTFISPVVQISSREIAFRVEKHPSDVLTLQYKPLSLKNTCSLPFSIVLDLEQPFLICDVDQQPLPADAEPLKLRVGEELHLYISFNPAYEKDLNSWETEKTMRIRFVEHPHEEEITVRGEVHFPNLHIQPKALDFGCIMTDTEQVCYLEMTNCSPVPARYHWSFQLDSEEYPTGLIPFQPIFKPPPPKGRISCFECSAYSRRHFRAESVKEENSISETVQDSGQQSYLEGSVEFQASSHTREDSLSSQKTEEFEQLVETKRTAFLAEEVFDVLPVSGVLQPSETQQVPFTFFGHANIVAHVTALCSVEGGPTYEVELSGEASGLAYHLSVQNINCGPQLFNEVLQAEVTLRNNGKIGFTYTVLSPSTDTADSPLPSVPMVMPNTGYIEPGKEQVLKLYYLPGLPGVFCRTFQLQVGHLKPAEISVEGVAVFPRIAMDLPWNIKGSKKYKKLLKEAKEKLEENKQNNEGTVLEKAETMELLVDDSGIVSDTWLKMQMEEMLMKESALKLLGILTSSPPEDIIFDKQIHQKFVKVELPEYFLDMGAVVVGCTVTHIVRITNTGCFPVSFRADDRVLHDTGFSVDLEPVYLLTYCTTKTMQVLFESASLPVGEVDVLLPIKVARGPTLHIHLHATVVQLAISMSRNRVQFSEIQVGQCQDETVRLYNRFKVPCHWFITVKKPAKKKDKRLTPAMHQKGLQATKAEPCAFSMEAWEGVVHGEAWCDLRIRFAPTEEKFYKNDLKINLHESSQCLLLHLSGQGLEPRLDFSPTKLNLGAVLPCSLGVEKTVVVKNPCKFPIEFYSLEFDEEYLEEEKVLRQLKDFRRQRIVLMPPRAVGAKLPSEVLEDYEKWKEAQNERIISKLKEESGQNSAAVQKSISFKKDMVEIYEGPVYRSLKRYLNIDASVELHRAQKPWGIVVIVFGTPLTGKTTTAVALSKYYHAACLSLDTMVIEAMSDHNSLAGLHARDLCAQAAIKQKSKEKWKPGKKAGSGAQAKKSRLSSGDKGKQNTQSVGRRSASDRKTPSEKSQKKHSLTSKTSTVASAPEPQWLTITTSTGEKVNCLSCVLPEELLVDIISARLKLSDCYKGVVFDGLETLFASSLASSLLCVLKAVNNRPHIHAVNIFQDYDLWKDKRIAEKEREERKAREQEEAARRKEEHLWNVDEDEYDALPKKQKILLNNKIRQVQRERKERELQQQARELEGSKKESQAAKVKQPPELQKEETKSPEDPSEREKNLELSFSIYQSSQKKVKHIMSCWDRVQGIVNQEEDKSPVRAKHIDQREVSLEKAEKKPVEKHRGHKSSESSQLEGEDAEGSVGIQDSGVPCLDIQVVGPEDVFRLILESNQLPPVEQILDLLGVGPSGPPIPPGSIFSMVPYPMERDVPTAEDLKHFILGEPEGAAEEDNMAPEAEATSSKGHSKKRKAVSRQMSVKEKQSSTHSMKSSRDSFSGTSSSSLEMRKSLLQSASTVESTARPRRFRWIVPAHGEVEMKIHFSATVPGQFEQMMNFELLGSKRLYQLPCSGTSLFPSISQNPRLVFPHCRKSIEEDDIIFKEYVMSTEQFHFGPLLCGKSREWYKAQNCPGNCEKITIFNNSPMEVQVHFSFEKDGKAETFLLDPPNMTLKPKEKQKLTIWAYPTSAGFLEDKLICCVKDNPEPVVFQMCCEGVHVKLEVSPQDLCFNKVLLQKTDSQTLVLKNNSPLPMAWQLSGLDDLGEEFSLSQDKGIVGPRTVFEVRLDFKGKKIGSINKIIRLEVSDTENILGIVHVQNIKISTEVCGVNLIINFPKGADGNLDFGTINVQENKKQVLGLKNRATYNIEYSFKLKTGGAKMPNWESHFTIQPQAGVLKASRPPVNVEVLFHPKTELFLKSKPILLCQMIDPSLGQGGKPVTTIPVSVSANAVFSKYSIQPASDIDFGAVIKGTKKSQILILENKGMLAFKYSIRQAPSLQSRSSQQEESAPAVRETKQSTQAALTLGMFTVSPCSGSVAPWSQQKITVDCNAGPEGKWKEQLCIDISGRDPSDNPLGIPFTLTAESCFPTLIDDIASIFEQYPIYSSSKLRRKLQSVEGHGVFVSDANKFIFTKVLIGQQATAHLKISNGSCLPCDVTLSIKAMPGMPQSLIKKIFKLSPVKMSIPGLSHAFAKVTFSPQEDQLYECTFTASIVIPKSWPLKIKPQQLTFTISGEGNKPQVTVVCPELQSKRGNPVLRFRRLLLGESQTLPLVLCNKGILPAQFTLHVVDEQGVFFMKGRQSALDNFHIADIGEDSSGKAKKPQESYLLLQHGQSAEFDVFFKPTLAQHLEGKICVAVAGNSEEILIELVGEGYDDEFTLDNLPGQGKDSEEKNDKEPLDGDIIEAVRVNHIDFGECTVRTCHQQTFTITNRSKVEVMRFEWLADAPFQFSPTVGHLQPGCAKDIRVTLKSDVPVTLQRHCVTCKVAKIKYELPPEEVYDWDDTMCTSEWVDTTRKGPAARWPGKEKVAKTLLEPPHTFLEKSSREVELYLSALVDYGRFKLNTAVVQCHETRLFQTSTSTFRMYNTGNVPLKYSWEAPVDTKRASRRSRKLFSSTLMCYFLSSAAVKVWFKCSARQSRSKQPHSSQRPSKRLRRSQKSVNSSLELSPNAINAPALFSIEPRWGTIPAGKGQVFKVTFCPTQVGNFKKEMHCRLSNLRPYKKSPRVIVTGRGWMQKAGLKDSDVFNEDGTQSTKPRKSVHWTPVLE